MLAVSISAYSIILAAMKHAAYICNYDATIRKRGERIVVEKDREVLSEIRLDMLDTIILLGPIQFTTQVVFELAAHGIELAICTTEGKLIAQLTPPAAKNVGRLIAQCDLMRSPDWTLESSCNAVRAKITGCAQVLNDHLKNKYDKELFRRKNQLLHIAGKLSAATNLREVRAIEGEAGKLWFDLVGEMLLFRLFKGRSRRPPRDPVNSLLSFGYSLAASEINGLIDAAGLNPNLGFLHAVEYGRPSLALDLLEEFRGPLVDKFVIRLFNLKQFSNDDFESRDGGVYLKSSSMKRFLRLWEAHQRESFSLPWPAPNYNEAFRAAINRLREAIDTRTPYRPHPLDNAK